MIVPDGTRMAALNHTVFITAQGQPAYGAAAAGASNSAQNSRGFVVRMNYTNSAPQGIHSSRATRSRAIRSRATRSKVCWARST